MSPRPRGRGSGAGGGQGGGARPAPAAALQKGSGGRRSGVCRRAGQGAAGGVPAPSQFPSHFPSPLLFPLSRSFFFSPPPPPPLSRSHPAPGPCGGRCAAGLCSPASPWGRCWPSLMPRGFSTPPPPPCPTAAGTASTRPAPARGSAPGSPWASTSKRPHARTLRASPHRGAGSGPGSEGPAVPPLGAGGPEPGETGLRALWGWGRCRPPRMGLGRGVRPGRGSAGLPVGTCSSWVPGVMRGGQGDPARGAAG